MGQREISEMSYPLRRILREHNPENDLPAGPAVSWAEASLAQALLELKHRVDVLESQAAEQRERIEQLESQVNSLQMPAGREPHG